jgi:hypothetical protein
MHSAHAQDDAPLRTTTPPDELPPLRPAYAQPTAPPPHAAPPSSYELPEETWGQTRVLGKHSLQRGTFVPSALVDSFVGIRAGLEYHQVPGFSQLPALDPSGTQSQAVTLRTINVAETLELGIRLLDFLAIFGDGYGKARIGADTNTLLGTGADYTYGGDVGVLLKLFRLGPFQLAVRGQVGYYAGQTAGISALFQDLSAIARTIIRKVQTSTMLDINAALAQLNTGFRTATADLLTPFSGFTYGASLNAALALGRFVGLQGSFGFYADSATYRPTHYDEATEGPVVVEHTVKTSRPSFGVALDIDGSPAGLPLAVLLEYRATPIAVTDDDSAMGSVSSVESLIALGVFYSGRTDLQLGLTGYTLFGQTPTLGADSIYSDKPLDLALQLVFRYFW